jgi:hypothetical protein
MGVKQIPTKVFLEYLKFLGLVFIRKDRWNHDIYDYPEGRVGGKLLRAVAVRTNYKEIPLLHIHTNLVALDKSKNDFEDWLKSSKKAKKKK